MHVNNYFIETLVLCFSCGHDPNNIQSANNLGLTTNTSCSMDAGKMVIGKQIQWTDKIGSECTGNGPVEHNLESIKNIIRLQFVTPPPSCTEGKDKVNQTNVGDVVITVAQGNATKSALLKEKQTYADDLLTWLQEHPDGQIIVIITAKESRDTTWPQTVSKMLHNSTTTSVPMFVIIVDWSKYAYGDYLVTVKYANKVARDLTTLIHDLNLPIDRLTLIGFGTSAHVAGHIGYLIKTWYEETLYRIIALDPIALVFNEFVPTEHKLNKTDAAMVMVVHTESPHIGYCCNLGSIDVYVNDPTKGQPWCSSKDRQCAHQAAVQIFIMSYLLRPVDVRNSVTDELLEGFPLDVSINTRGVYQLFTREDGTPARYLPGTTEPTITVEPPPKNTTFVVPIKESQIAEIKEWVSTYPDGEVIIILTTGGISGNNWVQNLTQQIKNNAGFFTPRYILVVEWYGTEPDFDTGPEYFKQVADALTTMLYKIHVSVDRVTIIGFGVSAHVAGQVGKLIKIKHKEILHQIIALSPLRAAQSDLVPVEDRLNDHDASRVTVIHTESDVIGYCCALGTMDVVVNDPDKGQPWCGFDDRQCSHEAAIQILIMSLMLQPVILRKNITDQALAWNPLDMKSSDTGVYFLKTIDNGCDPAICGLSLDGVDITLVDNNSTAIRPLQNKTNIAEITQWVGKHPHGEVIIILTAGETVDKEWPLNVTNLIKHRNVSVPKYILVVDWSKNHSPDVQKNFEFAKRLARGIATLILEARIPVDKITILGFGINTHVAGSIGKLIQGKIHLPLQKIVALNPLESSLSENVPSDDRLNARDAKMVIIVHTESSKIGYCCNVGTIDVLVNDPVKGQPWCDKYDPRCSHEAAINTVISSYKLQPVAVTNVATGELLTGFPFNVPEETKGVYHMATDSNGKPVRVNTTDQLENYDRDSWPVLNFTMNPKYLLTKANKLKMSGLGTHLTKAANISFERPSKDVMDYLKENPYTEVFVIVTEQPSDDWALELREAILRIAGPKFVIIVDWSMYVSKSYIATSSHAMAVAYAVSKLIQSNNISHEMIEIIGFSTSAHIAGLIGTMVQSKGGKINKITALDPEHRMWAKSKYKISGSVASTVEVIHTNTREWGILEKLGTYDFYINGGEKQPQCTGNDLDVDACSHRFAVDYYIESIKTQQEAYRAKMEGSKLILEGNETVIFGYHLIPHASTQDMLFLLATNLEKPYLREKSTIAINEPARVDDPNWPPVEFISTRINQLVLDFIYADDSSIRKLSIGYSGRNPKLPAIIRKNIPIDENTPIFIIIDGENVGDDSWADVLAYRILKTLNNESVIIHVNWAAYVDRTYSLTAAYSKAIGHTVAAALSDMDLQFPNIHIIGFSIGAHIAGFIGKEVQAKRSSMIGQITGLDPARRMFEHFTRSSESRLSKEDASLVDVYHTNAGVYGYTLPIGTIDFYINGGYQQPGCSEPFDDFCSHIRAVLLYIESVDIRTKALGVGYQKNGRMVYTSDVNLTDFGIYTKFGSQPGVYQILTDPNPKYLRPFSFGTAATTGLPTAATTGLPTAATTALPTAATTGLPSAATNAFPTTATTALPTAATTGLPTAATTGLPSAATNAFPTAATTALPTAATTVLPTADNEKTDTISNIENTISTTEDPTNIH